AEAIRDWPGRPHPLLLFRAAGVPGGMDSHRDLGALAFRRQHPRQQGPAAPHERPGLQRLADSMDHLRRQRFSGRGGRPDVRVLPPVHQPAQPVAGELSRDAADGDRRRRRHVERAGGRRGAGSSAQERGQRLHRPVDHAAGFRVHHHRDVHAGRHRRGAGTPAPPAPSDGTAHREVRAAGEDDVSAVVEVADLCKSFGGLQVTRSVNLRVEQGERHLLIGPNGAGKTTLFNLIAGDLAANSGSITLLGKPVTRTSTAARAQLGLARTYQIVTLFGRDNLLHNVKLALLGKSALRWRHWGSFDLDRTLSARALEVLDSVGLASKAQCALEQTSYGEKRRLEIAMALAQNPQVLLLDEPLAGLSPQERESVIALLRRIDPSITIIMIEHDMEVALAFA